MALLDFGTTSGLAYRHNYQQDIANLQRNEMLNERARAQAENKAAQIAEELKFGSADNEYDRNKLREFTTTKMNEIGGFMNSNPDYRFNPEKFMYYKQMANSLQDNEWVKRSMYHNAQLKEFQDYVSKHPDIMTDEELEKTKSAILNYQKTGDVLGEEGQGRQFTFIPPQPHIDLAKHMAEQVKNMRKSGLDNSSNPDYYLNYSTDQDIADGVAAELSNRQVLREVKLAFQNMPKSELAKYEGMEPNEAYKKYLINISRPFTQMTELKKDNWREKMSMEYALKKRLLGDKAALSAKGSAEANKPFWELAKKLDDGVHAQGFGYSQSWNTKINDQLFGDLSNFDASSVYVNTPRGLKRVNLGYNVPASSGKGIYAFPVAGQTTPMVPINIEVTPDQLEQLYGDDVLDDGKVNPEYADKISMRMVKPSANSDAEPKYYLQTLNPIDVDKNTAMYYNALTSPSKYNVTDVNPSEDEGEEYIDQTTGQKYIIK